MNQYTRFPTNLKNEYINLTSSSTSSSSSDEIEICFVSTDDEESTNEESAINHSRGIHVRNSASVVLVGFVEPMNSKETFRRCMCITIILKELKSVKHLLINNYIICETFIFAYPIKGTPTIQ